MRWLGGLAVSHADVAPGHRCFRCRLAVFRFAGLLALTLLLASCDDGPPSSPKKRAPGDSPKAVQTTRFHPIAYFNQNCARCHGPYGSFYGRRFGAGLTDRQLREKLQAMTEGPGNAPLTPDQLDVQMGYHRSLADGRPFILLSEFTVNPGTGVSLAGEVTPGSRVQVSAASQAVEGSVTGHEWKALLPPGADVSQLRIAATKGTLTSEFSPYQISYSHSSATASDRPR
jgi:hypothetical protein